MDLTALTTSFRFCQIDPTAAAKGDSVLSPEKLNFRNVVFLIDSRGRGHCQAGSAQDYFLLSLLWSSDCQWQCIHHPCKYGFSPATHFRGSVWMTWLEKYICLTPHSNFHRSLFSGVPAVLWLSFNWFLFGCCNEERKTQYDRDTTYRLSKKYLYLLKRCVISGYFQSDKNGISIETTYGKKQQRGNPMLTVKRQHNVRQMHY